MLDGEVRDAFAGIELAFSGEGLGRADIEALSTGAAMIGGEWSVESGDWKCGKDAAQKALGLAQIERFFNRRTADAAGGEVDTDRCTFVGAAFNGN